jgi:hypothetical protein
MCQLVEIDNSELKTECLQSVMSRPNRTYSREQRPVDWLCGLTDAKIEARRENGGRLDDERGMEQLKALATAGAEGGGTFVTSLQILTKSKLF